MKEVQILMWDDLAYAEGEVREQADQTVRLMLDDELTELDLTTARADTLRKVLAPYFAAGTPPGDELRKPHRAAPPGSGVPHVNGQPPEDRQERWRYNEGMRAYADERGIDYRANADRTPYYSASLRAEYAAWLKAGGR